MRNSERTDIYTRVTNEIVAAIEAGAGEWRMPWHHDGSAITRPINAVSRKAYRGANILSLWIAAQANGYTSGLWASYRQWQSLGAQVRKGEHATTIVFWKISQRGEQTDDQDDSGGHVRMFARGYSVFNEAQVEGYVAPAIAVLSEEERVARAEEFFANLGIATIHGGNEAYYLPSKDRIHMPPFSQFKDQAAYYGTLCHFHACRAERRAFARTR